MQIKPLRFGTSGLRALVTEMTDKECYINTQGFVLFLEELKDVTKGGKVALGGDLRSSTPRIMGAVKKAIEDMGISVDYCGRVPSPTLAHYAIEKGIPSIMVTGSHIPDDRNGIKFTKSIGEVVKSDESLIIKNVSKAREAENEKNNDESIFDENGFLKTREDLPDPNEEAISLYKKRYLELFSDKPLSGKKIVLYEHSAVGRDLFKEIFLGLGAELVAVARSEKFISVDTEKVSTETKDFLKETAQKEKPFAILSTDGDSDRPLFTDENGEFLSGDKLGALAALYLKPNFVALPVSTNDAVVKALKEDGIGVVKTRIGSPYVVQAMIDKHVEDKSAKLAAWEANGGFLTGTDWTIDGKILKALPTRDALLPMLSSLLLAIKEGVSLSFLFATRLPARYTSAGAVDNTTEGCEAYTADMGKEIVKMFSPKEDRILAVEFGQAQSCTVAVGSKKETASDELATELIAIKESLKNYFASEAGFADIKSINFIDGIRIAFVDGDIAHMRPSGNAPEFRMYAEADTERRAQQISLTRNEILPRIIKSISP